MSIVVCRHLVLTLSLYGDFSGVVIVPALGFRCACDDADYISPCSNEVMLLCIRLTLFIWIECRKHAIGDNGNKFKITPSSASASASLDIAQIMTMQSTP